MNCHEFRRKYAVTALADFIQLGHIHACKSCARFAQELARINRELSMEFELPLPLEVPLWIRQQEAEANNFKKRLRQSIMTLFLGLLAVAILNY